MFFIFLMKNLSGKNISTLSNINNGEFGACLLFEGLLGCEM